MAEIKLNKRYKYAGDIFRKLIGIGFDIKTATDFLNEVADADVAPVVRCKDCKHLIKDIFDRTAKMLSMNLQSLWEIVAE